MNFLGSKSSEGEKELLSFLERAKGPNFSSRDMSGGREGTVHKAVNALVTSECPKCFRREFWIVKMSVCKEQVKEIEPKQQLNQNFGSPLSNPGSQSQSRLKFLSVTQPGGGDSCCSLRDYPGTSSALHFLPRCGPV